MKEWRVWKVVKEEETVHKVVSSKVDRKHQKKKHQQRKNPPRNLNLKRKVLQSKKSQLLKSPHQKRKLKPKRREVRMLNDLKE